MQLWLVQKRDDGIDGPWGYDCSYGFVIRAEDETQARALAAVSHGDEGAEVWTDLTLTSCEPLEHDGEAGILLQDFLAG